MSQVQEGERGFKLRLPELSYWWGENRPSSLLLKVTVICCVMFASLIFFDCLGTVASLHNDCHQQAHCSDSHYYSSKFHSTCNNNYCYTPCKNPGGKRVATSCISAADYASITDNGVVLTQKRVLC